MCNTQGMNLVLNVFFGPIANAAYSISYQIYNTVAMFANNFYVAVKPALIKNYAAGNYEYVNKLFQFSSKSIFLLLYVIILPIIISTDDILNIWLGEVGEYMVSFVRLSLIYTLILILSYPITAVVQASGSVKKYHGLVDGFSLLALPLIYILFRLGYDASYAYLVSILIFTIAHIIRLYVLKRVFNTFCIRDYLVHFIIPSLIVALLSYIFMVNIGAIFPDGVIGVIFKCILSCIVVIILGSFIVLSKLDRTMILNLIKKS
jgi:O-antigen/teichoic acid export membrane protein